MISGDLLFPLFFVSLCIFLCSILIFRLDILQPAVIVTGTMTVSVLLAALNIERWGISVGINTFLCISMAMGSFLFGNVWVNIYFFGNSTVSLNYPKIGYDCSNILLISILFIECVCAYLNFNEMYSLSIALGNNQGISFMISTVRQAIEHHQVELSKWMNYRFLIVQLATYTYLYVFFRNIIFNRFKFSDLKLLLPFIPFVPVTILTTGRMALMSFIIFLAIIFAILYEKKYQYKNQYTCIGVLISCALLFCVLFLVVGQFAGKHTTTEYTPFVMISHYAGLSIAALDVNLTHAFLESPEIGSTTLLGIYRVLSRLGMALPEVQIFLPFVRFNNIDTNVYTAEWRYVADFGYLGMCVIMWLISCFYSFLYGYIKHSNCKDFIIIFYGTICNPLFLSSIDERFFLDLFGTAILYNFVLVYIFYKIIMSSSRARALS